MPSSLIYRPHTLERFASENFYLSSKSTCKNPSKSCSINYEDCNVNNDDEISLVTPLLETSDLVPVSNDSITLPMPDSKTLMLPYPPQLPHFFNHNGYFCYFYDLAMLFFLLY